MTEHTGGTRIRIDLAAVVAVLAVAVAGCGGSSGSHVAQIGSTTTQTGSSSNPPVASAQNGAVAFARCMRSHRVPNWPDPNSSGGFDKSRLTPQQLGAGSSQVQAAQSACQHLLPNGGRAEPGRAAADKAQALRFSRAFAPTVSRTSPTRTAAAAYPTLPPLESIRVRHVPGRKPSLSEIPAALHSLNFAYNSWARTRTMGHERGDRPRERVARPGSPRRAGLRNRPRRSGPP